MDLLLRRYFWVVNLTVLGLCAGLVGRAVSHVVEGAYLTGDVSRTPVSRRSSIAPLPKGHSKDIDAVVKRDVFCSACTITVKDDKGGTSPSGPISNEPTKSSLQIELVSTMVVPDDAAWSMAVLRDLAGKEHDAEMFNRGKKIFATGAVVKEVQSRRVYIDNAGKTEYLDLDDKGAAPPAAEKPKEAGPPSELGDLDKSIQCNGNNCTIERALVDKALANTGALMSMARLVPSVKDGKPNGFKVYAVRKGSLFDRLGMQNGDTLKSINNNELTSPDGALALYTKLRSASHLNLQVERRGETVNMDYTIK